MLSNKSIIADIKQIIEQARESAIGLVDFFWFWRFLNCERTVFTIELVSKLTVVSRLARNVKYKIQQFIWLLHPYSRASFCLILLFPLLMSACSSTPNENVVNIAENKTTPTQTATPKKDFETDAKLQLKTDSLLPLFDKMPRVPIYVKDEPIIRTGSETQKGVAYTLCEVNENPVIYMKKVFYQKANQKQLTNILKHELVHAWFCRKGVKVGHDAPFRKKFKEVGGFGN